MIRSWNFFFVFCFLIHMLVFAFYPRKHVFDRLSGAIIIEVLQEKPAQSNSDENLWGNLLLEVIALSEDFSGVEQPNFHLRPHRVIRYSFSEFIRVIKLVYLNQWVEKEEKPTGEYSNLVPLLPKYYSFLFRLKPF